MSGSAGFVRKALMSSAGGGGPDALVGDGGG
jgi:hypothetical protein